MQSKADISELNLPHGTEPTSKKWGNGKVVDAMTSSVISVEQMQPTERARVPRAKTRMYSNADDDDASNGDRAVTRGNPFKLSVNYCRTNTRKNFLASVL